MNINNTFNENDYKDNEIINCEVMNKSQIFAKMLTNFALMNENDSDKDDINYLRINFNRCPHGSIVNADFVMSIKSCANLYDLLMFVQSEYSELKSEGRESESILYNHCEYEDLSQFYEDEEIIESSDKIISSFRDDLNFCISDLNMATLQAGISIEDKPLIHLTFKKKRINLTNYDEFFAENFVE